MVDASTGFNLLPHSPKKAHSLFARHLLCFESSHHLFSEFFKTVPETYMAENVSSGPLLDDSLSTEKFQTYQSYPYKGQITSKLPLKLTALYK